VGDAGAVAGEVVFVTQGAGRSAHVGAARGEPAEPVIGVADALARLAVIPRRELEVPEVVGVIDRPRPAVRIGLRDQPVEVVVGEGDVAAVALAQARAVAAMSWELWCMCEEGGCSSISALSP
jgi:hypothetical protein